jgi:hypothetical protein
MTKPHEYLRNVLRAAIEEFVNSPETNYVELKEMSRRIDAAAENILERKEKRASAIQRSL